MTLSDKDLDEIDRDIEKYDESNPEVYKKTLELEDKDKQIEKEKPKESNEIKKEVNSVIAEIRAKSAERKPEEKKEEPKISAKPPEAKKEAENESGPEGLSDLPSFILLIVGAGVVAVVLAIIVWLFSFGRMNFFELIKGFVLIAEILALLPIIIWTKVISADPPFVGAETRFGALGKKVYAAGYFLTIPYIRDVIPIDMRMIDQDFVIQDVVTKDNAVVKVTGHLSFRPDIDRIGDYIATGKVTRIKDSTSALKAVGGVLTITDNIFPQYQRKEVHKLPLDDALGASENLTNGIVHDLTGIGKEFEEADKELKTIEVSREQLKSMNQKGEPDIRGLGVKIFVANVTNVEVTGKTKEALEKEVQEQYERKGEVVEIITRVRQSVAKMLATRGIDITTLKDKKGKEDIEKIQAEIKKIRDENPKDFDASIDEWVTAFIEYESAKAKPGSVIPGLRERLKRKDGSIPFDVILSGLADLFRRPTKSESERESTTEEEKTEKKAKRRGDK